MGIKRIILDMKTFAIAALMGVSLATTQIGDDWSLAALGDLMKGNENVQTMSADMTADVMDEWQTTLDQIARELEKVLVMSNDHIEKAIEGAEECAADHPCVVIPDPPTDPNHDGKIICRSNGDPHVRTYDERKIDVQGHGVFSLSKTDGVQVEAFHCPADKKWIGASVNAGVAFKVEATGDVVQILGDDVWINGVKSTEGTSNIALMKWADKLKVRVRVGDFKIVTKEKYSENIPTDYMMNVSIEVEEESNFLTTYGKTICGIEHGHKDENLVMTLIKSSETLFSAENYQWLVETCGVPPGDDWVVPEDPVDPETVCIEKGIPFLEAETECRAACHCADEEAVQSCIFDYCALGGDSAALQSCDDFCDDMCEDDPDCIPYNPTPVDPTPVCDEGVTNQYTYYVTTIQELQDEIKDMEDQIDDLS